MYSSTYGPSGYQPGHMGPGMMGDQNGNYSGSGMMGGMMTSNMMMGNMMALYYPESKPITQDTALRNMQNFSQQYGSRVEVEDFMIFSGNYYAVLKDLNSSQNIAEVLVDRYSGLAYAEPGPNMMWNTR